jgi:hypothetical protein
LAGVVGCECCLAAGDYLQVEELVCAVDEPESYQGYEDFADGSDGEGSPALRAEVAKVSAQADSGNG